MISFSLQSDDSYHLVDRYSINQGESVWHQLLYGIRYLDIRVGYYRNTPEKFWIVHNFIKMIPLYEVLQAVRKFLLSTQEVLVMDFHRFPKGFQVSPLNGRQGYLESTLAWAPTPSAG